MAEVHTKPNHDYHLVEPSPWPILGAIGAFTMAIGGIMWMKTIAVHGVTPGSYIFGAAGLVSCFERPRVGTRFPRAFSDRMESSDREENAQNQ